VSKFKVGAMTISELQKQAHEIAKSKGWWDEPRSWEEIVCLIHSEISEAFEEWRAGRMEVYYVPEFAGGKIVTLKKPEGFPIELADIVIRLMDWAEHEGWVLTTYPEYTPTDDDFFCSLSGIHATLSYWKFNQHERIDDCYYRVQALAVLFDIDLESAILTKMAYNKTRSYRHGGKKA